MILGHHIGTTYGFMSSIDYAYETGAKIMQLFLRSPQKFNQKRRTSDELLYIKQQSQKHDVKVVIHASFMLNFCNPLDSYICKNAIRLLKEDLEDSITLGAIGVVVHMGKNVKKLKMSTDDAIKNYVHGVKIALKNSPKESIIIFETGAGQGSEVCTDIIDLGNLRLMFDEEEQKRIKFCIDTCHIFSAGYDLGSSGYVDVLDKLVENYLGWSNVIVVHLNDSKQSLNCRKDRHADIGQGCIKLDGLFKFIKICVDRNIPMVLETPEDEIEGKKFSHEDQMKFIVERLKN